MMSIRQSWRLYLALSCVVLISEAIGQKKIHAGHGVLLLLPMVYAMIMGFLLNPRFVRFLKERDVASVQSVTMIGIALLAARIGASLGPNLKLLSSLSVVMVLQELGHFLGTVILSLPVAVLLGLGREAIGGSFSLAREGAVAIIGEKFGLDSPEGRGVISQYFFGTLFGALYMGFLAGWVDSLRFFAPESLAMASGLGSASMMAAAAGALIAAHPDKAAGITAVSGAANLLTMMTGLYFSLFVSLPLAQSLYRFLDGFRRRR
jgi:hypothetical protein